jgi:hypothetical protein
MIRSSRSWHGEGPSDKEWLACRSSRPFEKKTTSTPARPLTTESRTEPGVSGGLLLPVWGEPEPLGRCLTS